MRVIKVGVPPEQKPYEATCRRCHTEIEFLRDEAKLVPDQRDGDFLSIRCPVCNYMINVTA